MKIGKKEYKYKAFISYSHKDEKYEYTRHLAKLKALQ
jgi:hypothetical protein